MAGTLYGKAQVRPARPRRGQHVGQLIAHAVLAHADANQLGRRVTHDLHDVIVDRKEPPRRIDDLLAHRGERDTRRALVEQFDAEQPLQAPDLGTDRRLRHALGLGGAGEAPQLDDRDEGAQQVGWNVGHA